MGPQQQIIFLWAQRDAGIVVSKKSACGTLNGKKFCLLFYLVVKRYANENISQGESRTLEA